MATIKYFTRSKKEHAKIYIRFTANRNINFMRSTPLTINPKHLNNKTGKVRNIATFKGKDQLQKQLNDLSYFIIEQYNRHHTKGVYISANWLQTKINTFFNIIEPTDLNYLDEYAQEYINNLKTKTNDKTGELGASKGTIAKYKTIKNKILNFQEHKKTRYKLIDVNLKFRKEFLNYMLNTEKLARNTAGRYIKFLKTIVLDGHRKGFKTSKELQQIKGFSVPVEKIYLTFDELDKIQQTTFKDENLQSARDWLLIGCEIGQRVSDLLRLTPENITLNGSLELINLIQQKTKKRVSVVVTPRIKEILNSRSGKFPKIYSKNPESNKVIFNRLIKEVCKIAGITEVVQGSKMNPKTARKQSGQYPKYQLVTSHICRRSFATNYYGQIPTPLIINQTGHSTEKEFLNYIGKTPIDYAEQMAMYMNLVQQKQAKKSILKLVK